MPRRLGHGSEVGRKTQTAARSPPPGPDREIEPVALGNEQRGSGARDGRNACELLVAVAALLDDLKKARAEAEIDALALGVEKDIVGVAAGRQTRQRRARVCVEHSK